MGENGRFEYGSSGKFSGDRTIHGYANGIWNLKSIGVNE
jgi:glucan phosphorylase